MMASLVYILAASHSGSTLLAMLLGSHPQIATVGELKLSASAMGKISRYRCSCGEFIRECPFWHKVKEGIAARGFAFDIADAGTDYRAPKSRYARLLLRPLYRGMLLEGFRDVALGACPSWRKQLSEIQGRNAVLVSTVAEITGAKVVVDSSKIAVRLKYLLRNPQLDIKVIRLIRDGRAVALTYMDPAGFADAKDPVLRGGGSGGQQQNERLPMDQAAHQWRRCNEEAENVLRGLDPSQWFEVRYEELCRDTEKMLSRLFEFLGLDSSKRVWGFRTVEHHVVGNGMRLDTTSEIRLDERWRENLTDQDLRIFNNVAGKMNRRYGYLSCIKNERPHLRVMFFEGGEFGGSVRSVGQMIKGLSAQGCEVGLVSHYRQTGPEDLGTIDCIRFWRSLDLTPQVRPRPALAVRTLGIPRPTSFGMRYFFIALRALRRFRPDIAYLNNEVESDIPVAIAAKLFGIPTVCHLRIARDLYPVERVFAKIIDQFIVLTKAGQRIALANGIPEQKLTQVYNPFDISTFDKRTREALSQDIPWESGSVNVIQVGALNSRKRPMLALDAFAYARAKCPKLRLIFAGSGPLRDELEQAILRRGLDGSVHLIGNCLQIPALLSHCDIGLFVSASEGLGRVILEFMGARLPVVTWNMPVFRELVKDGHTGFLVSEPTPELFAEVLIRLYRCAELRKRIGRAGREWVLQGQFDISRYMQYMHSLLLNVANRRGRKRFSQVKV